MSIQLTALATFAVFMTAAVPAKAQEKNNSFSGASNCKVAATFVDTDILPCRSHSMYNTDNNGFVQHFYEEPDGSGSSIAFVSPTMKASSIKVDSFNHNMNKVVLFNSEGKFIEYSGRGICTSRIYKDRDTEYISSVVCTFVDNEGDEYRVSASGFYH